MITRKKEGSSLIVVKKQNNPMKKKFHEITKWTLFVFACNYGHKYVVKLFLDYLELTIKLNRTTNGGKTAFICACLKGYKDVVKLLSNIEVNVRTNYG